MTEADEKEVQKQIDQIERKIQQRMLRKAEIQRELRDLNAARDELTNALRRTRLLDQLAELEGREEG